MSLIPMWNFARSVYHMQRLVMAVLVMRQRCGETEYAPVSSASLTQLFGKVHSKVQLQNPPTLGKFDDFSFVVHVFITDTATPSSHFLRFQAPIPPDTEGTYLMSLNTRNEEAC